MSYEKGIEAAVTATSIAWHESNKATLGVFLAAFLAEQPEVLRCVVHRCDIDPRDDPENGCELGQFQRDTFSDADDCRVVEARIVVEP